MASHQQEPDSGSGESFDEEDLVCALNCLEATADIELAEQSHVHDVRTEFPSSCARSLAEELEVAKHSSVSLEAHGLRHGSPDWAFSPMSSPHTPGSDLRKLEEMTAAHQDSEGYAAAAQRIQRAWRRYKSTASDAGARVDADAAEDPRRVNPFCTPDNLELCLTAEGDGGGGGAAAEEAFSPDDISPLDPTYHMAAVAAQLRALALQEKHLAVVAQTTVLSGDDDEVADEVDGPGSLSAARRAKLLAPSMQICFTARPDTELSPPHLPASGRESRGTADGASAGSPVGTDDERSDKLLRVVKPVATKTTSCESTVSRSSVEDASDAALPTRSSSPRAPTLDSEAVAAAPYGQSSGARQRANQVFDESLLSQLSELHLQSLCEEYENEVQLMSEELVTQLTERDTLVSDREEYNRLFRKYSKMQKEPTYSDDSAMTWPSSFQEPTKPASSTDGILSRTRNALRSKIK